MMTADQFFRKWENFITDFYAIPQGEREDYLPPGITEYTISEFNMMVGKLEDLYWGEPITVIESPNQGELGVVTAAPVVVGFALFVILVGIVAYFYDKAADRKLLTRLPPAKATEAIEDYLKKTSGDSNVAENILFDSPAKWAILGLGIFGGFKLLKEGVKL